jgi:hypothetical protein
MFLEILIMDVLRIIIKNVGFILVVEMEKLTREKPVKIVRKMYEYVVEMEN